MNEEIVNQIKTYSQPDCILCGTSGAAALHSRLHDRLFGSPGNWDLVRCRNPKCALVWLNPMPEEKDIGLAYNNYYTHSDSGEQNRAGVVVKKLGLLSLLSRITGLEARKRSSFLLYLDDREPGKLLEIGCGDGNRLIAFRSLGWDVVGQETDPCAANSVRKLHGIDVLVGPIEEQKLADKSFDAIIMNHVLEHVHNPVELIRECFRLLKPGGILSIVTPNSQSFGHKIFNSNWRGLEPPRHLYLYSVRALEKLVSKAGFSEYLVITTAINSAGTITQESLKLRSLSITGSDYISLLKLKVFSHIFRILEYALLRVRNNIGEECVLLATRSKCNEG